MGRGCKEPDVWAEIVSSFPATKDYVSRKPTICSLRLTQSADSTYREALLCQQGTPGSTATLSPTLRLVTFGPSSTTVLQHKVGSLKKVIEKRHQRIFPQSFDRGS